MSASREAQQIPLSPQGDTQMSKFYWYQCVRYCIAHLINGSVLSKLDANSWTEQGSPQSVVMQTSLIPQLFVAFSTVKRERDWYLFSR